MPSVTYKLDKLHSYVNAAKMTTRVAEDMLDERFRVLVENLERRRVVSGGGGIGQGGGGGGGIGDVVRSYVQSEVPASYIRDATPQSQGAGSSGSGGGGGGGGGLMDLMRALSRVDTTRHPSQIGDQARRAAREVQRIDSSAAAVASSSSAIGGSGGGGGGGESITTRRLTAVYPAGILSSGVGNNSGGSGSGSVVMTPRKVPGTPRRYGTPGRERERTPGR